MPPSSVGGSSAAPGPTIAGTTAPAAAHGRLLAQALRALANQQIVDALVISERTARTHVSNILGKLGVASRTQAALLAIREGIAPAPLAS
jgi:DNA-binding CsgD family transcriptional regulator